MVEGGQEKWESRRKVYVAPSSLLLVLLWMKPGEKEDHRSIKFGF